MDAMFGDIAAAETDRSPKQTSGMWSDGPLEADPLGLGPAISLYHLFHAPPRLILIGN
jgi:hypothetical protein